MEKINNQERKFSGSLRYDEPMFRHCTFKVGGKADVWVRPAKDIFPAYTARLLKAAKEEEIPVFILGAGANIVVSDRGIRGIVLDTGSYRGVGKREDREAKGSGESNDDFEELKARRELSFFSVSVLSGTSVDALTFRLAERGLSGVEFLAGMPGSVGGAVWMNARCYEKSVSDVLIETEILNESFEREKTPFKAEDFSYKKSPFQERDVLILSARFAVQFRKSIDIYKEMEDCRQDRSGKGHYRFPSAGSAFKNNRDFNEPTGRIIDQLGMRGLNIGGAQVAPWHGNLIINTGNATASDIRILMSEVARRVKEERGFDLESEILFVGDWGEG
jgi:UDP-N-acetylmuramate dehydrogenase